MSARSVGAIHGGAIVSFRLPCRAQGAIRPVPLALAIHLAFVAGGVILAAAGSTPAHAQAAASSERGLPSGGSVVHRYDIPAGPLGGVLARFASESGALLAAPAELIQGKHSAGLQGTYGVPAALGVLLEGTGLEAVSGAGGQYRLQVAERAPSASPVSAATLAPVTVTATTSNESSTEGTGSYTATGPSAASSGLNLSLRETPQSVSVMTRQRMDDQGLTQLTDVAAETPGLFVSQGGNIGSDSSPIYSRGFSVNNYMVDGVKQLSSYSSIFQSQDMGIYDRVEVVRGANGLMAGGGTAGASLNLIRKRPAPDFQGSVNIEYGSWDHRRVDADLSVPFNEAKTVRGRLVVARQRANSYIDRLKEDRTVVYGVVEAELQPQTTVRAGVSYQALDYTGHARGGLPAYFSDGSRTNWSRSDSAAPNWSYSNRRTTTAFAEFEHALGGDWQLKGSLSRTYTDSDELVGYASGGYPNRTTGAGVNIWATHWVYKPRQDSLNLATQGSFELLGRRHDLSTGVTFNRSKNSAPGYTNWYHSGWSSAVPDIFHWDGAYPEEPANPAVQYGVEDERNHGGYVSARFRPTDRLSVIAGTRLSYWQRTNTVRTYATGATTRTKLKESANLTPYAGIVYDLAPNWSVYTSYTTIFQPQNYKTPSGGTIDPLQGNSYEIGTKADFFDQRLNLGAAIYQIREDNKAISIPDVYAPDGSQAYRAVSGTKSRGFEVEASGELRPGWELAASFTRNLTQDRDGQKINTNVPQNMAKLFTTYRLASVGHGLTVGGGIRWQSAIYSDNLGPTRTSRFTQPSYSVVDLMARYPITRQTTVYANIGNLFDKKYFLSTGNSYYGEPRSFRVGLNVKF